MQNIIIRNVKQEDFWAVSSIVVEGWKSAYRGIIADELLDRFMACSHTSICVGKDANGNNMIIEGNTDGVIRKIKITDRNINNLLFVGRIDLSKK